MAKVPAKQIDSILGGIANSTLSGNEIKVFCAWFRDAPNTFSANPDTIERRTGIDKSNVKKIMKSLIKKGVLIPNGSITTTNNQQVKNYDFGALPKKEGESNSNSGVKNTQKGGGSSTPISTNKHTNTSTNSEVKYSVENFQESVPNTDGESYPEKLSIIGPADLDFDIDDLDRENFEEEKWYMEELKKMQP